MSDRCTIGVIFGGRSGEHEVSLVSATSIMGALPRDRFEVVPIGISKDGAWYAGNGVMEFLKRGKSDDAVYPAALSADNKGGVVALDGGRGGVKLDAVFPVLHGPYGEDGTVQGLLDLAGVPYVGCGVLASAVAMDKVVSKEIFIARNIPTAPYVWFHASEWRRDRDAVTRRIEEALTYPLFIKPANMGSSVGIFKVKDRDELTAHVPESARYDRKIVVEEAVADAREIEVAVLGNDRAEASVPGEIFPSNEFYDYDAKYVDGKSKDAIPADLSEETIRTIRRLAVEAFSAVDGAGLARVDFLVSRADGRVFLNELNTLPGFTSISMYPKLWQASGLPYPDLLSRLVDLAIERHREKQELLTSYQPKIDWHKG
ncbi:MAG: D-alanine--D-alanine ligase [Deltaproteobacteria bacterium]|nr:D-alanine--D-alanine ligase [Candidatus Zymogenaceae bacterium]